MSQSSWRWPLRPGERLKQRLQESIVQVSEAVEALRQKAPGGGEPKPTSTPHRSEDASSKRLNTSTEGVRGGLLRDGLLRDGVSEFASRLGLPLSSLQSPTFRRLQQLRPAQMSRAAGLLSEVVPRHFQTGQTLIPLLPSLLSHSDDQLLGYFQTTLVSVLQQDVDAGPMMARTLIEKLEVLPTPHQRPYLARVLRGAYLDVNLALVLAEELPGLLENLPEAGLDAFLRQGFSLWRESSEKATSFFRLESRQATASLAQLRQGLNLSAVKRTLQLYAQSHGGPDVRVKSLRELPSGTAASERSAAFTDGKHIFLPEEVDSFATQEENFRLYKAMTAIESGRLEFGTFAMGIEADLQAGHSPQGAQRLLEALASLPEPAVGRALFQLLETYRIEQRIIHAYPGLRGDLERLTSEGAMERPTPMELPPLQAVTEALAWYLWRRPLPSGVAPEDLLPVHLRPALEAMMRLCLPLQEPTSQVETTLHQTRSALHALAVAGLLSEESLEPEPETPESADASPEDGAENAASADDGQTSQESQTQPGGEASAPGGQVRTPDAGSRRGQGGNVVQDLPFEPLPHQGHLMLELAAELEEETARAMEAAAAALEAELAQGAEPGSTAGASFGEDLEGTEADAGEELSHGEDGEPGASRTAERMPGRRAPDKKSPEEKSRKAASSYYPEWDWQIQDYKERWTQVIEEGLSEASDQFATETMLTHGALVKNLRRQFQRLRREEFQKFRRQLDGDEVDVDAAVEALIERHAGHPPPERLYVQRRKQGRDVAVAFLVDMSSSTQQVVQSSGKTILDIEKESLLLMSEALESLGDAYAIYGFSGYGRGRVSFYVAKEFEENSTSLTKRRISAMSGRLENRDGAAIRHAVRKLLAWPARVRLLILLSDGRPLDCGCRQYFERYAQEDTRMALREAQQAQIHPFCITVDRQAQRYLSQMYGQVQYTIIDQVSALPHRLPLIYRRLTT